MANVVFLVVALFCAFSVIDCGLLSSRIPASSITPLTNPKERAGVVRYWLIEDQVNFNEADEICREFGQVLLSIESAVEQATIESYLSSNNKFGYYWTSGNDMGVNEDTPVWLSTQRKMYYQNFANPSGQSPTNDCVSINGDSLWNFRWMYNPCSSTQLSGFICELK